MSDNDKGNNNKVQANNDIKKEHSKNHFNQSLLDDGQMAFMQWLNSEDKSSTDHPLILRKYKDGKKCVLYDNRIDLEVEVIITDGIPMCKYCENDSCAHVGFTISTMQLCDRKEILIGEDTTLLDLFE